jgi:hypothetical protein
VADEHRLEHLELRRNDEVYLNALGAERIPDPTTEGDFCRRFREDDILELMDIFDEARSRVWKQQPPEFFQEAEQGRSLPLHAPQASLSLFRPY